MAAVADLGALSRRRAAELLPEARDHEAAAADLRGRLADALEQATDEHARAHRLVTALQALASDIPVDERDLSGRKIADKAIEILPDAGRTRAGVHYRDWYDQLAAAGYTVAGKDPLATFTTAINRHPRIERVGSRTGLYRITADSPTERSAT